MPTKPFSLYVHIPYCFHKCPYCDFNTYAVSQAPEREYTDSILSELDFRAALPEWKGREVQTIFFGGGTPSLFHPTQIGKVIGTARNRFQFASNIEISLEANPGTISYESLAGYREAGVNRLSIGAQSFNVNLLKKLGRIHTADQIHSSFENATQAGFLNINLDLMFGIPDQTLSDFQSDLTRALEFGLAHISAYGLTIEKGTPFYSAHKRGDLKLPPEESVIEMMQELENVLPSRGFQRYEISNFSKPLCEARHNLAYWNGDDYLGLGAGAHSFNALGSFGRRWANYALPAKYAEAATSSGNAEGWHEELDLKGSIFEFFFLGLRKIAGVSQRVFSEKFGIQVEQAYPRLLDFLSDEGLLTVHGDQVALSSKGILVADSVIGNFADPDVTASDKNGSHIIQAAG